MTGTMEEKESAETLSNAARESGGPEARGGAETDTDGNAVVDTAQVAVSEDKVVRNEDAGDENTEKGNECSNEVPLVETPKVTAETAAKIDAVERDAAEQSIPAPGTISNISQGASSSAVPSYLQMANATSNDVQSALDITALKSEPNSEHATQHQTISRQNSASIPDDTTNAEPGNQPPYSPHDATFGPPYPPPVPQEPTAPQQSQFVVRKKKGRFRILEDAPAPTATTVPDEASVSGVESGAPPLPTPQLPPLPTPLTDVHERTSSTGSIRSSAVPPNMPSGNPDGSLAPAQPQPVVTKKGRFMVSNVIQDPSYVAVPGSAVMAAPAAAPSSIMYGGSDAGNPSLTPYGAPMMMVAPTAQVFPGQAPLPPQQHMAHIPAPPQQQLTYPAATVSMAPIAPQKGGVGDGLRQPTYGSALPPTPEDVPATAPLTNGAAANAAPGGAAAAKSKTQQQRKHSSVPPLVRNVNGGLMAQSGLGKVMYFLDQMRAEVAEADRNAKALQSDMKLLKEKNKELEAKLKDAERRAHDEKLLREAAEARIRTLKKKLRGLKGEPTLASLLEGTDVGTDAHEGERMPSDSRDFPDIDSVANASVDNDDAVAIVASTNSFKGDSSQTKPKQGVLTPPRGRQSGPSSLKQRPNDVFGPSRQEVDPKTTSDYVTPTKGGPATSLTTKAETDDVARNIAIMQNRDGDQQSANNIFTQSTHASRQQDEVRRSAADAVPLQFRQKHSSQLSVSSFDPLWQNPESDSPFVDQGNITIESPGSILMMNPEGAAGMPVVGFPQSGELRQGDIQQFSAPSMDRPMLLVPENQLMGLQHLQQPVLHTNTQQSVHMTHTQPQNYFHEPKLQNGQTVPPPLPQHQGSRNAYSGQSHSRQSSGDFQPSAIWSMQQPQGQLPPPHQQFVWQGQGPPQAVYSTLPNIQHQQQNGFGLVGNQDDSGRFSSQPSSPLQHRQINNSQTSAGQSNDGSQLWSTVNMNQWSQQQAAATHPTQPAGGQHGSIDPHGLMQPPAQPQQHQRPPNDQGPRMQHPASGSGQAGPIAAATGGLAPSAGANTSGQGHAVWSPAPHNSNQAQHGAPSYSSDPFNSLRRGDQGPASNSQQQTQGDAMS